MIRLYTRVDEYGDSKSNYVDTDAYFMTTARVVMERPNGMFEIKNKDEAGWRGHYLLPACQVVLIKSLD